MKLIKYASGIFFIIHLIGCNLDFKETQQVSKDTSESRQKRVFISEYEIRNLQIFDSSVSFPIDQIWRERRRYLVLDSNKKQAIRVDSNKTTIVFNLKDNAALDESSFLNKWYIWDSDSSSIGLISKRIILQPRFESSKDSIHFSIYHLSSPYNFKNGLIRLFDFVAVSKRLRK